MRILLVLALMAMVAHADDAPTLELPELVKGEIGKIVRVQPKQPVKVVRFRSTNPGLILIPNDLLKVQGEAICIATKPGRYRLEAWACLGESLSDVVGVDIEITEPTPIIPPIPPDDVLLNRIQAIYSLNLDPNKAASKTKLVNLFAQMAGHCSDVDVVTASQLVQILRDASKSILQPEDLKKCRVVLSEYLNAALPTDPATELTTETRKAMAALFNKVARTLEAVK
jgi:hypothetical protein